MKSLEFKKKSFSTSNIKVVPDTDLVREEIGTNDHVNVNGTKICLDRMPFYCWRCCDDKLIHIQEVFEFYVCKNTKIPANST